MADAPDAPLSPQERTTLSKIEDPAHRATFVALRKQRAAHRARTAPKKGTASDPRKRILRNA